MWKIGWFGLINVLSILTRTISFCLERLRRFGLLKNVLFLLTNPVIYFYLFIFQ